MWRCQALSATSICAMQLPRLQEWCRSQDTDPSLTHILVHGIHHWYNPTNNNRPTNLEESELYHLQEDIGWDSFLEGFQHTLWQETQQKFYEVLSSRRTRKHWCIALMKQLWDILKLLWWDHNDHKHKLDNRCTDQEQWAGDRKIKRLYRRLECNLLWEDEFICRQPLEELLQKSWAYRREWLSQATVISNRLYKYLRCAEARQHTRAQSQLDRRRRATRSREMR